MDEDEDDDGPRNLNKPDGDKKTKEKMKREQEASSLRKKIDAMHGAIKRVDVVEVVGDQ